MLLSTILSLRTQGTQTKLALGFPWEGPRREKKREVSALIEGGGNPINQTNRTARNSKPLEVIGTYDPIPKVDSYDTSGKTHKDLQLDIDRAKYWIGVGAQPTDTVWRFLSMVSLVFCLSRSPCCGLQNT